MISKVEVWYMTEEERLQYIEKHPIKPTKRSVNTNLKWRSEKANKARWGYSDLRK